MNNMCKCGEVCKPISELISLLEGYGFRVIKKELEDWHFNEHRIEMLGEKCSLPAQIGIKGIERIDDETFVCSCHWSIVRIVTI